MAQQNQVGSHKTTISTDDGYTRVTYHSTAVVKFNSDKIVLNSGTWRTNTTKTRMNQASNQYDLGYSVYQKNYEWFVDFNGKTYDFNDYIELPRINA